MKTYAVINKQSGAEVHRYSSETPVEWEGFEFAAHDHIEQPPEPETPGVQPAGPRRLTKMQFTDRMGDAAYAAILQMAKTELAVEVFVDRFRNATLDADGTSIDLDDPRTAAGIDTIGQVLTSMGVVSPTWADEVLNG